MEKDLFLIGKESWQKRVVTVDLVWKHYVWFFLDVCRAREKNTKFSFSEI